MTTKSKQPAQLKLKDLNTTWCEGGFRAVERSKTWAEGGTYLNTGYCQACGFVVALVRIDGIFAAQQHERPEHTQ